eukprot:NODE_5494_length_1007_cov_44.099548_g4922_i0.p1 GENE.NODE_5494_length_1007_cov_44.099548_g4922_i0~~NODE_5494_length_1007_cov_44.099548_g4922_i0.p1  ORF type:complete len:298 (+),score=24.85 NODE_5494_length_1007_cov_44.099548_g4922_i0:69-962(+)
MDGPKQCQAQEIGEVTCQQGCPLNTSQHTLPTSSSNVNIVTGAYAQPVDCPPVQYVASYNHNAVYPDNNPVTAIPYVPNSTGIVYGRPLEFFSDPRAVFSDPNANRDCIALIVYIFGWLCPIIWCFGIMFLGKRNSRVARCLGCLSVLLCSILLGLFLIVIIASAFARSDDSCNYSSINTCNSDSDCKWCGRCIYRKDTCYPPSKTNPPITDSCSYYLDRQSCWNNSPCGWCTERELCTTSMNCPIFNWVTNFESNCKVYETLNMCRKFPSICKCCNFACTQCSSNITDCGMVSPII